MYIHTAEGLGRREGYLTYIVAYPSKLRFTALQKAYRDRIFADRIYKETVPRSQSATIEPQYAS
jgi:hypothetical protein